MGDGENASLRLQFNPKVRLEFHGSTITSAAGLLAFREFDDALGLTEIAENYLQESRTGRNICRRSAIMGHFQGEKNVREVGC